MKLIMDICQSEIEYLPKGIDATTEFIKSLGDESLVFFDLETSGLSPLVHEIIEIAGVKISSSGEITKFQRLVKPIKELSKANIAIHGIPNEMLVRESTIEEVLPEFLNFCGDSGLVAYNAQFDIGFLAVDTWKQGLKFNNQKVYDAFQLTKNLLKLLNIEVENFKLGTLANHFGFKAEFHRAMIDTEACIYVLDSCLQKMKADLISYEEIRKNFQLFQLGDFKAAASKLPEVKNEIKEALSSGYNLEISYMGGSKGHRLREIKPIALLPMPFGFILYAICMEDKLNKAFKLKKIQKVKVIYED